MAKGVRFRATTGRLYRYRDVVQRKIRYRNRLGTANLIHRTPSAARMRDFERCTYISYGYTAFQGIAEWEVSYSHGTSILAVQLTNTGLRSRQKSDFLIFSVCQRVNNLFLKYKITPYSRGAPQMSKGHFLWYFLSCPGRKKVRKRTASHCSCGFC